jgi:CBS domain-containing protein
MNRTDHPLDGMLRHLGAAYYDSLHGRAAPTDVIRALDRVAEHIGEQPAGMLAAARTGTGCPPAGRPHHHDLWHSRVRDVMTTAVVTADPGTTCQQIAALFIEHEVSGVPVMTAGRHVAGVVSDADLIAARDSYPAAPGGRRGLPRQHSGGHHYPRLTAAQVMSHPAVTIQPDATISAAARLMSARHIRRLPVVDSGGRLTGIVSHRDLLSLFLRSDAEIAWQATEMLTQILPAGPAGIKVTVHDGIVTLTSAPGRADGQDQLSLATRLTWDIDGVVDVDVADIRRPERAKGPAVAGRKAPAVPRLVRQARGDGTART